ncbi:MAG: aspartate kinase [Planctomycetes bacterium]|nr:aspartate kinase [Planctomycetota bacterium]
MPRRRLPAIAARLHDPAVIVMKFGGAAVADASGIRRVVALVQAVQASGPVVVVSALAGATDALLAAATAAAGAGDQAIGPLVAHHRAVARGLGLPPATVDDVFVGLADLARGLRLVGAVTPRLRDEFVAHGERASARLVAAALRAAGTPAQALDAGQAGVVTDDRFGAANPRADATRMRAAVAAAAGVPVVEGFVGRDARGFVTTLGRNGSDVTAALFAQALGAAELQIWKDVAGVCAADPRVVPQAQRLRALTPACALALAACGSRIVHPDALALAAQAGVPIVVRGVATPDDPGTRIATDAPAPEGALAIGHVEPGDPVAPTDGLATLRALAAAHGGALVGLVGAPSFLVADGVAAAARSLAEGGVPTLAADALPAGDAIAFAVPADRVRAAVALLHQRFFAA